MPVTTVAAARSRTNHSIWRSPYSSMPAAIVGAIGVMAVLVDAKEAERWGAIDWPSRHKAILLLDRRIVVVSPQGDPRPVGRVRPWMNPKVSFC